MRGGAGRGAGARPGEDGGRLAATAAAGARRGGGWGGRGDGGGRVGPAPAHTHRRRRARLSPPLLSRPPAALPPPPPPAPPPSPRPGRAPLPLPGAGAPGPAGWVCARPRAGATGGRRRRLRSAAGTRDGSRRGPKEQKSRRRRGEMRRGSRPRAAAVPAPSPEHLYLTHLGASALPCCHLPSCARAVLLFVPTPLTVPL